MTRRLTRREVKTVCSLINEEDREFIEILLAHVRVDSVVARAVVRGICRAPEMLTPSAAENLLRLLKNQGPSKYARNLSIEVLRTINFASSLEVVQECAEILAENASSLTVRQRDKLIGRAVRYPASRRLQPWPEQSEQHGVDDGVFTGEIDYAGAVSVLLLTGFSHYRFGQRKLLEKTVQFARNHSEAKNFWVDALSAHAPAELYKWQAYLSGSSLRQHLIGGVVRAMAATTVPWLSLQLAGWLVGAPKPPGALLISVATLSPIWGLQIAMSVYRDMGKLAEKYDVPHSQKKQVVEARC